MDALFLVLRIVLTLAMLGIFAFMLWRRFGGRLPLPVRSQTEQPKACPQLGLAADPFTNAARPDDEHRCYANLARERIDLGHQQRFCLASTYKRCPFLAVAPRQDGMPARARAWWRTVSPALPALVSPQPGLRPWLGGLAALASALWQAFVSRLHRPAAAHAAEASETIVESPVALITPSAPIEPVVEAQPATTNEHELVHEGIAALEAGHDLDAYQLFKRATQADKRDLRAWYWRAKTSETLNEVIDCLERAYALDQDNEQIASNLASARERQQALKNRPPASSNVNAAEAAPGVWLRRRPTFAQRAIRFVIELGRIQTALAAFAVGAVWLLTALPPALRTTILGVSGLSSLSLPDTSRLTELAHLSLTSGYDVGSALPFAIGFLALFVGVGLMAGDGWTRLLAPAIGVASAWAWQASPDAVLNPLLLPACGVVVLGGALSSEWRVLQRRMLV
jgi:hypothetical protein